MKNYISNVCLFLLELWILNEQYFWMIFGTTLSYFKSLKSIFNWLHHICLYLNWWNQTLSPEGYVHWYHHVPWPYDHSLVGGHFDHSLARRLYSRFEMLIKSGFPCSSCEIGGQLAVQISPLVITAWKKHWNA